MEYLIGGGILGLTLVLMGINMKSNAKFQQDVEYKYVTKEMCAVLHKQTADDLSEIKSDVKELLRQNGKR
jgi:hypothetical protein